MTTARDIETAQQEAIMRQCLPGVVAVNAATGYRHMMVEEGGRHIPVAISPTEWGRITGRASKAISEVLVRHHVE